MTATNRGVITLAYGKPSYVEMAKNLARSLRLHSPHIPRAIVTSRNQEDRELKELFHHVIELREEYGSNMRQKLHLDKYSPYDKTAYIDSDCIAVRDIDFVFEALESRNFSTIGQHLIKAGDRDMFVDVKFALKHFGIEGIPKFNGGFIYFDKSETAYRVFETARELLGDWKELGFVEVRSDGPNDERIFGVAMALHNQTMFSDRGQVMYTPIGLRGPFDIDVLTGRLTFQKYDTIVSPAVVHFACMWSEHPVYFREIEKLNNIELGEEHCPETGLLSTIKYRFGYQIAFVRYVLFRVPKTRKYFMSKVKRAWPAIFRGA